MALTNLFVKLFPEFVSKRRQASTYGNNHHAPANGNTSSTEVLMHVPLSKPDIGEQEINNVVGVLRSGRLSLGPRLPEFEEKFAAYVGRKYAVALNSGTSALHLCIRALGIGSQDEVITTAFSFVASTNCILFEGALPAFIDIDPATLNMDANQLCHFLQHCCTFDSAPEYADRSKDWSPDKSDSPRSRFRCALRHGSHPRIGARIFGLDVIEDSCEALGAEYRGRRAGTFGDAADVCFLSQQADHHGRRRNYRYR